MNVIWGKILCTVPIRESSSAWIYIQLKKVHSDQLSSMVIAEKTITHITLRKGRRCQIPYRMILPDKVKKTSFTIQAHVDIRGDRRIARGDFVSRQDKPIVMDDPKKDLFINVRVHLVH